MTKTPLEQLPAWLKDFVVEHPIVVASFAGGVAYFLTRMAQTSFYSKFGVEPEDVGLGRAETLSRLPYVVFLLALLAAVYLLLRWLLRLRRGSRRRVAARNKRRVRTVTIVEAVVLLVAVVAWMPLIYQYDANRVRDGKALRPPGLSTPNRLVTNPLGLRVEPVRVSWIDEKHQAYDFGRGAVMYLGRSGGMAVFFDPTHRQTVRVPESDVVIKRKS